MCLTLVLHADDFGFNSAVTGGILRGFEHGLLTSTSLLANAPAASLALAGWRTLSRRCAAGGLPSAKLREGLDDERRFDLGVHLNLTQGRPLTGERYPADLLDDEGRFPGVFRFFARMQLSAASHSAALRAELDAQIAFLVEHGIRPTHLNGHQYVELVPQVSRLLPQLMARYGIPTMRMAVEPALLRTTLRHGFRPAAWLLATVKRQYALRLQESLAVRKMPAPASYFGTAHAGRINGALVETFLNAAGESGTVEIGLHPGLPAENTPPDEIEAGWADPLSALRSGELELLQSEYFAAQLRARGIRLGRLDELSPVAHRRAA